MYIQFMQEYETMGHMTKIESYNTPQFSYYMPHHGILRNDSLTTKLRVVFDASAPTNIGYSSNQLQMVGPTIQNDLLSIILRFRKHTFVITADIEKMYRQVLISTEQRSLQRILWRANSEGEISAYDLNTVTYGTAAAAFLAIRCVYELAQEQKKDRTELAKIIENDFYVDDLLTGADSLEDAACICRDITKILKGGRFELRKFITNNADVLKYIEQDSFFSKILEFGENQNTKTLGLMWCCKTDTLMYNINNQQNCKRVTKRNILSAIAQIFDPLGLLSPCTIVAKIMMQNLWLEKISWDEAVPANIHIKWSEFISELPNLNELRAKRHVICSDPSSIEIHGFADASEGAYGACAYIRSIDQNGEFFTSLLCSKTKVAPLKSITIPRLELCGALILARMISKVTQSLDCNFNACYLWSDSTSVLGWLKTPPNLLNIFVSNRIAEIQDLTSLCEWHHVSTGENPVDLLSRGMSPSELSRSKLWWFGPSWLSKPHSAWPNSHFETAELPEVKDQVKLTSLISADFIRDFPFERFSNLNKLKRVMGYLLRFIYNCRNDEEARHYGSLSLTEIDYAPNYLIKLVQRDAFPVELISLSKTNQVDQKSKMFNLNPFLDSEGIIRVGGRLTNSNFLFEKRHPIILSSKHHFTKLLFDDEHKRLMHLLASVRERFWPLLGRNLARKTVRECIKCFRTAPMGIQPFMGNLPAARLQTSPPFSVTGVDYAGPFFIRNHKGRGSKTSKCYISLFICFSVKAIHLELVADLTKDSFIMVLKRFVSRRGKPTKIMSNNGTNFIGANSELRNLGEFLTINKDILSDSIKKEDIEWEFIPPRSPPHFGGLWEAGVKSCKHHLKRVIGNAHLTFEEFYTVLTQVEAILNSRPLYPLSSSPTDLNPFTPADFQIGRPLTTLPEANVKSVPENRLTKYQRLQQLHQHFWERWNKEYVSELQQRTKWKKSQGELKEGTMVVVKEDNLPPTRWRLGRISSVHPGSDGVNRVATIRTSNGTMKRAFSKICPLPVPAG